MIGQTLGHYHVLEKIGQGGMDVAGATTTRGLIVVVVKKLPAKTSAKL